MRSLKMFSDDLTVSKNLIFSFHMLLFCLAFQGRKSLNWVIKSKKNLNCFMSSSVFICIWNSEVHLKEQRLRSRLTSKNSSENCLVLGETVLSGKGLMTYAGTFVICHENRAFTILWLHVHRIISRKTGGKTEKQNQIVNCLGILAT